MNALHDLLFPPGTWIFPFSDTLIRLFPEQFWRDALAALAGTLLGPGATEMPLILLMLASAILSLLSIMAVIRRARALGLAS